MRERQTQKTEKDSERQTESQKEKQTRQDRHTGRQRETKGGREIETKTETLKALNVSGTRKKVQSNQFTISPS